MSWIDITHPVEPGMRVYSADEGFSAAWLMRMPSDGYNLSRFSMGAHCGTHLDAPRHFVEGGLTIEHAPLNVLNGRALVADLHELGAALLTGAERLILIGAAGGLSARQADAVANAGVRLLGVDGLSVGMAENEADAHVRLFSRGVWALENLRLEGVEPGWYDLLCLPLPLVGLEASPVRAALRGI